MANRERGEHTLLSEGHSNFRHQAALPVGVIIAMGQDYAHILYLRISDPGVNRALEWLAIHG